MSDCSHIVARDQEQSAGDKNAYDIDGLEYCLFMKYVEIKGIIFNSVCPECHKNIESITDDLKKKLEKEYV